MAKKQANPVDLRAELKKRVKSIQAELITLNDDLRGCVNERAHFWQYYNGRIVQAEAELAYLKALLDG